jgi:hypothetical protein
MPCLFCRVVNTLCYWGPRQIKAWKRPVLCVLSVPILLGGLAFTWAMFDKQSVAGAGIGLFIAVVGALGIGVSLRGCDQCVARMMADGF